MDSGEVYLGGYGLWKERGEPTGIHDPVWARAFVVVANGTALANAVLDVPGIANGALAEIAQTVEALTGGAINRNAVLVSSTHTHAGPDLQGLWGGVSPAYRQQVVNWTVDAIVEAYATRRPARLLLSVGAQQANNRRGWGYTDEDVTVLDLWDEQLNTRIGTVVNYAAYVPALWRVRAATRRGQGLTLALTEPAGNGRASLPRLKTNLFAPPLATAATR